jgi:hypothetical protein
VCFLNLKKKARKNSIRFTQSSPFCIWNRVKKRKKKMNKVEIKALYYWTNFTFTKIKKIVRSEIKGENTWKLFIAKGKIDKNLFLLPWLRSVRKFGGLHLLRTFLRRLSLVIYYEHRSVYRRRRTPVVSSAPVKGQFLAYIKTITNVWKKKL